MSTSTTPAARGRGRVLNTAIGDLASSEMIPLKAVGFEIEVQRHRIVRSFDGFLCLIGTSVAPLCEWHLNLSYLFSCTAC